ncbi:ROK family protein [Microbacterium sp. ABRD28]|nr:ROK family protein [Microbacterium sp. ABRD28]
MPEASTVTSLRQRNRSLLLKQIILRQETTRAELAHLTGLSAASAANIVAELIDEGLVEERGNRSSQGGRPITVVGPRADRAITIGIDVGERGVAAEVFDLSMTRVDREFRGGQIEESPDLIAADIRAAIDALRDRNGDRWGDLIGIGLGLPGIVETDLVGTQTLYAQSLGWPALDVVDLCSAVDVPVFAENGAKLQARVEHWFGNARDCDHALVAMLGRGVGLGIITAGEVATGSRSAAGEWGHTTLMLDGEPCRCGNRGCVEAYLGADAIVHRWRDTGAQPSGSGWTALTSLIEAADAGDPAAADLTAHVIDELGAALGSLVNLFNPERVLIGGWVGGRLIEAYRDELEAAIVAHALPRPGSQFTLHPTHFAGDAVAAGAGLLPLEALIVSGWSTAG